MEPLIYIAALLPLYAWFRARKAHAAVQREYFTAGQQLAAAYADGGYR